MPFGVKASIIAFLIIVGMPLAFLWYRHTHHAVLQPLSARPETTITIIPGWNLRDVASYLVAEQLASSTADVYAVTGKPATLVRTDAFILPTSTIDQLHFSLPSKISLEGYLAPETYRVYSDATVTDIVEKLLIERDSELMNLNMATSSATTNEILTVASLVEDEAKTPDDRRMVADILWRRVQAGMPLQLDSSVHYAVNKTGDVYTTQKERDVDSPWNTYKYAGLPPGPICNPSIESIKAALNPEKNSYWYFLSGTDGTMHYAKTLDEQDANIYKYLR